MEDKALPENRKSNKRRAEIERSRHQENSLCSGIQKARTGVSLQSGLKETSALPCNSLSIPLILITPEVRIDGASLGDYILSPSSVSRFVGRPACSVSAYPLALLARVARGQCGRHDETGDKRCLSLLRIFRGTGNVARTGVGSTSGLLLRFRLAGGA